MPFIRGRYHINAIAGEALEAAREAEAALRALEQAAQEHQAEEESGGAYDRGARAQRGSRNRAAGDAGPGSQRGRANQADNSASGDDFDAEDPAANAAAQNGGGRGPIRRVEIEAAEMVPAHSGRAERGIVARVHRDSGATAGANSAANSGGGPRRSPASPETHVFSGHGDLLNFLSNEFAKDARKNSARAGR